MWLLAVVAKAEDRQARELARVYSVMVGIREDVRVGGRVGADVLMQKGLHAH